MGCCPATAARVRGAGRTLDGSTDSDRTRTTRTRTAWTRTACLSVAEAGGAGAAAANKAYRDRDQARDQQSWRRLACLRRSGALHSQRGLGQHGFVHAAAGQAPPRGSRAGRPAAKDSPPLRAHRKDGPPSTLQRPAGGGGPRPCRNRAWSAVETAPFRPVDRLDFRPGRRRARRGPGDVPRARARAAEPGRAETARFRTAPSRAPSRPPDLGAEISGGRGRRGCEVLARETRRSRQSLVPFAGGRRHSGGRGRFGLPLLARNGGLVRRGAGEQAFSESLRRGARR
jgi:hypothetical protein